MHWFFFLLVLARAQSAPYWIPSSSMSPTLMVGDYMFAPYIAADGLTRGDVVIFRHPVNGMNFVMRLIGLPGDTVQMQDGRVILNGAALQQEPEGQLTVENSPQGPAGMYPRCGNGPVAEGEDCTTDRFRETLPDGRSWHVLNIGDGGFMDNTDVYTVPPGHAFLLGDNRDNSMDSRFSQAAGGPGFVPLQNIFARPNFVFFSSAGSSLAAVWTWRTGRLMKYIQ